MMWVRQVYFQVFFLFCQDSQILFFFSKRISWYPNRKIPDTPHVFFITPCRIDTHSHTTQIHTHCKGGEGFVASLVTLFSTWHQHRIFERHDDMYHTKHNPKMSQCFSSLFFVLLRKWPLEKKENKKRARGCKVSLSDSKCVCVCVPPASAFVGSSAQNGHLVWKAQVDWLAALVHQDVVRNGGEKNWNE